MRDPKSALDGSKSEVLVRKWGIFQLVLMRTGMDKGAPGRIGVVVVDSRDVLDTGLALWWLVNYMEKIVRGVAMMVQTMTASKT